MKEISIHDISGFQIGHAQDHAGGTGCSVVICPGGATAGVCISGGGPATRETDLLRSEMTVDKIHAVMLSGGSAYGLDACSGAMKWLCEKDIGFSAIGHVVPIVCGASLFDLIVGNPESRPDKKMGYDACENSLTHANANASMGTGGNVGAGTGAAVGKYLGTAQMMKSGLGTFACQLGNVKCGAIVAVNAVGDVYHADTGKKIAGLLTADLSEFLDTEQQMYKEIEDNRDIFSGNTTIGCIITNVKVTKSQANKIAAMAHDGYARVIKPVHTSADGDGIFTMSTGDVDASPDALGTLAAHCMAKAVTNAVLNAAPAYGLKCANDFLK